MVGVAVSAVLSVSVDVDESTDPSAPTVTDAVGRVTDTDPSAFVTTDNPGGSATTVGSFAMGS